VDRSVDTFHCFVATFGCALCAGGRNQVPAGLDGGDGGESHVPSGLDGGDGGENHVPSGLDGGEEGLENDAVGDSSPLSQMGVQRTEASPDSEPLELASELPSNVLSGLPNSVDLKDPRSADLKVAPYSKLMEL